MKIVFSSILLILLFTFSSFLPGCATTPARKLVPERAAAFDLTIAYIPVETAYTPLIPYFAFTAVYGLTGCINAAVVVNPSLLLLNPILYLEPSLIFKLLDQNSLLPSLAIYASLPLLISLNSPTAQAYPLAGLVPRYSLGRFGLFGVFEVFQDHRWETDKNILKFNARVGVDADITCFFGLSVEAGLNELGERSVVYGWAVGQPVVKACIRFTTRGAGR